MNTNISRAVEFVLFIVYLIGIITVMESSTSLTFSLLVHFFLFFFSAKRTVKSLWHFSLDFAFMKFLRVFPFCVTCEVNHLSCTKHLARIAECIIFSVFSITLTSLLEIFFLPKPFVLWILVIGDVWKLIQLNFVIRQLRITRTLIKLRSDAE